LQIEVLNSFGEKSTALQFTGDTQKIGLHHIIAHGYFDMIDNPLHSGILLAGQDGLPSKRQPFSGGSRKNIFSGALLMFSRTTASHVTLQACSVGRSHAARGDEFWGMPRACLIAGADSVIAPLWDIDIKTSTELLISFYENWLIKGAPKHQAWAESQRRLWTTASDNPAFFYHWSPFRLIGL
jgi:CHAT domain-containing protein